MRGLRLGTSMALALGLALGACAPDEPDTEMDEGMEGEAAATGEMEADFSEWDVDTDASLNSDEFEAWWNENAPDFGEEEAEARMEGVSQRVYRSWDTDRDDRVSEQEWREGTEDWGDDEIDWGDFTDWDGDGDSELDANEVREGLEGSNVYERIDKDDDEILDDEELADWFFDLFDANDDESIDQTEWDQRGAWRDDFGLESGAEMEGGTEGGGEMNR